MSYLCEFSVWMLSPGRKSNAAGPTRTRCRRSLTKCISIRDRSAFKQHWTPDLDRWFEKGIDTPNLVLLKVAARRITCWEGNEESEAVLA